MSIYINLAQKTFWNVHYKYIGLHYIVIRRVVTQGAKIKNKIELIISGHTCNSIQIVINSMLITNICNILSKKSQK